LGGLDLPLPLLFDLHGRAFNLGSADMDETIADATEAIEKTVSLF
jgi:hypothetical protein